jgi:hypothetical protein
VHDEWGRPVSPDGAWVWDGTQWQPRQQPAAPQHGWPQQPQHGWPQQPQHGWSQQPGGPLGGSTGHAAMEAELQSYPRTWRLARQGILRVAELLEPGEVVHASAPGSGDVIAPALALITVAATAQRSMVVVATDRRLLFCQLTVTSRDIAKWQGLAYEHVESWRARTRSLEVEGVGGVRAYPNQLVKAKLLHLRSVVEPRLVNARLDIR